jgi:predicted permease
MLTELLSEIRYRVRAIFRRADVERELREELRFHLDHEVGKLVRDGVPREEAERRARVAFGGIDRITEEARDARGVTVVETTLGDLRYALRGLRARPAFTAGVVLTLGLGIGANAAMFGIVDRLLFRAPPFLESAERVHRVYLVWTDDGELRADRNIQFARYLDIGRWSRTLEQVAAFQTRELAIGEGEDVQEMPVTVASASYFDFFDARPALGRFFSPAEDSVPMGTPVVVLGHGFWQTRYGGRRDVLGEEIRIGQSLGTIIGVAPEGFVGMSDQGVPVAFMPITAYAWAFRARDYSTNYNWSWLELVVRRRPEVTVEAATADLTSAYHRSWLAESALDDRDPKLEVYRPYATLGPVQIGRGPNAGADVKVARWVAGVALVVLLIACANVANLLLSRAVARRREIAMRLALGASRGRLLRQLLTESFVLAACGGAAGILMAHWGGDALRTLFLSPDDAAGVVTDGRTMTFAALATLATALLTGLVPALQAGRDDLVTSLRGGAREGSGGQRTRTRTLLVLVQAALSVVLLVGAGLFVRSLRHVQTLRLGYDVDTILFAAANTRGARLDDAGRRSLNARLLESAQGTPGVTHAALVLSVPFWSNEGRGLYVPGVDSIGTLGRFILQGGSPDYFAAAGTRIVRGRPFDATDREHTPRVVVVSEGMARALWPGREAIGECIRIGSDTVPCTTVIGIAEDASIRGLADPREYTYYVPLAQTDDAGYPQLFVRVAGRPEDRVDVLRRRLQTALPGAAYVNVVPMRSLVDPRFRSWRFGTTMFVAFGGLALVLASIGLYSVIAYGVAQRVQELGIRIALGASVGDVVRMVVAGSLRVVVAGIVLGALLALWGGRWIETLLFRQSPRDPAVFGAVAVVLLLAALVASVVPALRAARVDPNVVLRGE